MAVVREHLVVGGDIVEQSGGGLDDEGAPPPLPGMRVHDFAEAQSYGTKPMTEEEMTHFGATLPKPKKSAPAPKVPKAKSAKPDAPEAVSDRRRCLELAVASGETDPDTVLAIAGRYLGFLIEGEPV